MLLEVVRGCWKLEICGGWLEVARGSWKLLEAVECC